jgi:hypothetical protein
MVDVVGDTDCIISFHSSYSQKRLALGPSGLPKAPAPPPRITGAPPLPIRLLLLLELCAPLDPLPLDEAEGAILRGTVCIDIFAGVFEVYDIWIVSTRGN